MDQHQDAVTRRLNISFKVVEAEFKCEVERFESVFGCVVRCPAVGDQGEFGILVFTGQRGYKTRQQSGRIFIEVYVTPVNIAVQSRRASQ